MDIEAGNAGSLDTGGTGWFVGSGPWTHHELSSGISGPLQGAALRFMPRGEVARDVQIKWMVHPAGDPRGDAKPPSVGRTISLLVSEKGRFRLEFSCRREFPPSGRIVHTLRRHGDFVIWGPDLHHRWRVEEACTILTVRWTPLPSPANDGPAPG